MKRIGIYGGTFNPPHIGHIRAAEQAIQALELDILYFVPDRIAPHKSLPEGSPTPEQRFKMLEIATKGMRKVRISDIELCREGVSYSYETVAQLRQKHPKDQLYFLMGSDMFLSFPNWRHPEKIMHEAGIAVLYRGDKNEDSQVRATMERIALQGADVTLIENRVTEISSTQLRRLLAFGAAGQFLSAGVESYIRQNGLYGTARDYRNLPMEELEQVALSLLKSNRVAHVLGCRDTAVALARHHGANETDAARAALLHDVTKALTPGLQLTLCRECGIVLDAFSAENPQIIHAITGSWVAREIFGENEAVVQAIACHTTGKPDMNLLEKIIYVADYMEPNRDFPGVEQLRTLAFTDITKALRLGLEITMSHLREQGRAVCEASWQAFSYLQENGVTL